MAIDLKKASVLKKDLPPLSIFPNGKIGHYVRYRISSEDKSRYSHWSPIIPAEVPDFEYLGTTSVSYTSSAVTAIWGDEHNRPRYDVYVRWGNEIEKIDILDNVATIHAKTNHGFSDGQIIEIVGTNKAYLDNKNFSISLVSGFPKRFTINIESGVPNGTITFSSGAEAKTLYSYHGTSPIHTYSFLRLPNFDILHVDVQVESIEKVYSQALLIYDSPAIHLV